MLNRTLTLTEYETALGVALAPAEAEWLRGCGDGLDVKPAWGAPGRYDLTPRGLVGLVALPGLTVLLRPKIAVERVLFLLSYALDPVRWKRNLAAMAVHDGVLEAMAALYARALSQALARGVQQGYRQRDETLMVVRGRVRFHDQLRTRLSAPIPLEVTYDDFTPDTDLNRLLLAALLRLRRLPLRSAVTTKLLASCQAAFADSVSVVEIQAGAVDALEWSRLNQHFRPAAELASAILAATSLELQHGGLRGTSFTVNMNVVFEEFVRVGLRTELGLSGRAWPTRPPSSLALDVTGRIPIRPDLTWFAGGRCVFVGDVKYKRLGDSSAPNADLYQLQAYATALGLPGGLLVYAEGPTKEEVHVVARTGARLVVRTLDVSGTPEEVLAEVRELAGRVRGEAALLSGAAAAS